MSKFNSYRAVHTVLAWIVIMVLNSCTSKSGEQKKSVCTSIDNPFAISPCNKTPMKTIKRVIS